MYAHPIGGNPEVRVTAEAKFVFVQPERAKNLNLASLEVEDNVLGRFELPRGRARLGRHPGLHG